MSPMPNKKTVPPEIQAQIDELRKAVARAESRGQHDTSFHTMLARLEEQYVKKELEDGK